MFDKIRIQVLLKLNYIPVFAKQKTYRKCCMELISAQFYGIVCQMQQKRLLKTSSCLRITSLRESKIAMEPITNHIKNTCKIYLSF